jgi:Leucine-rich repeat (LRR) protein
LSERAELIADLFSRFEQDTEYRLLRTWVLRAYVSLSLSPLSFVFALVESFWKVYRGLCSLTRTWQPHDSIDFTDNDIAVLGNFPLSPRITTLLLARNRVSSIQPTLSNSIPHLRNLVLASNLLAELADLDVLGTFTQLTHLVLADNPVTKKEVSPPLLDNTLALERVCF